MAFPTHLEEGPSVSGCAATQGPGSSSSSLDCGFVQGFMYQCVQKLCSHDRLGACQRLGMGSLSCLVNELLAWAHAIFNMVTCVRVYGSAGWGGEGRHVLNVWYGIKFCFYSSNCTVV